MKYRVKFKTDGLVNGKVVFEAGKVYEISNELGSVDRWVKRGHEIVEEEVEVATPVEKDFVDPEVAEKGITTHVKRSVKREEAPKTEVAVKELTETPVVEKPKKGNKNKEEKKVEEKKEEKKEEVVVDNALDALGSDENEVVNADVTEENK